MLTRYPQTFLGIGYSFGRGCAISEEKIFELRHARIVEHQRWVVFGDERGRLNNQVLLRAEEVKKMPAYFVGSHHVLFQGSSVRTKALNRNRF